MAYSQNLLLFSFLIVSLTFLKKIESKTHFEDIESLQQLKKNIDPDSLNPASCVSTWDFNLDPCDNLFSEKFTCGFRCDIVVSKLSRLTELTLDQAGYSGSLTSLNFPYLQTLDISNNFFTGPIPGSISNLTRLSRLSLSFNSFTGEIPSSVSSLQNLQELYLDNNNLQGTIPSSLNNLKSLTRLELQRNNLTGKIPNLTSLNNLYYIDLSDNQFSGDPFEIPASLPVSLVQISIRNNNLKGGLTSESFKNLTNIQVLDFSSNKINGPVPRILFQLPSLQQLTLSFNEFSAIEAPSFGSEPVQGFLQSELIAVDLSNNRVSGFLPLFLAFMPKLSSLSLENNRLTGLIPVQFALKTVYPEIGVARFGRLLLGGNYLLGGIPRPLLVLKQDYANVSLVDNCLFRCPHVFFFCQGGTQKSSDECSRVIIP